MASPATYMPDGFNSKDPEFVHWAPTGAYGWQVGWALVFWATRCLWEEKGQGCYFVEGWGVPCAFLVHRAGPVQALKLYKIGSLRNWSQGFLQNESPAL